MNLKHKALLPQQLDWTIQATTYCSRKQQYKLLSQYIFQVTAPGTPQQNSRVERKFSILYSYMSSMLQAAKIPQNICHKLWAEVASHTTDLTHCVYAPSPLHNLRTTNYLVQIHHIFQRYTNLVNCVSS
jgi:hypothetical protein